MYVNFHQCRTEWDVWGACTPPQKWLLHSQLRWNSPHVWKGRNWKHDTLRVFIKVTATFLSSFIKKSINTPRTTWHTCTHRGKKSLTQHSHLLPWRFVKPCSNSPITMTTTLSLPAVPVGGFRPAFSNFTLCGYLHSVITIPSILIFPVQTMCPGYTHTKISLTTYALTHLAQTQPGIDPLHPVTHTDTKCVCKCEKKIEGERQMWSVTTPNSPTHAITHEHTALKIQLQAQPSAWKLGLLLKSS